MKYLYESPNFDVPVYDVEDIIAVSVGTGR